MNLSIFADTIEKYSELDNIEFNKNYSKKDVINKLQEISVTKRKLQVTINDFLDTFLLPLEQKEILALDDYNNLNDFVNTFSKGAQSLDYGIYYRVHLLMLKYAKANFDINKVIEELYFTGYAEYIFGSVNSEKRRYIHYEEAASHINEYDRLSKEGKSYFMRCYGNYSLEYSGNFRLIRKFMEFIKEKEFKEPGLLPYDLLYTTMERNLASALSVIRLEDYVKLHPDANYLMLQDYNKNVTDEEKLFIVNAMKDVRNKLVIENDTIKKSMVQVLINYGIAKFFIKEFSLKELLDYFDSIIQKKFESVDDEFTAVCKVNAYYIEFVRVYSTFSISTNNKLYKKKTNEVMNFLALHNFSSFSRSMDFDLLNFVITTGQAMNFNKAKKIIYKAMIYSHPSTYIHTTMVDKISNVLVKKLLDDNPSYFIGMKGICCISDVIKNKKSIISKMKDMANLHDIGKFYVINYIRLSYRKLTKIEFDIIMRHPELGDGTISGFAPEYIREAIERHHLWYNKCGGYPQAPISETEYKCLVDVLSVADSIDAATDNIGRPYNLAKTYEEIVSELGSYCDTRYSKAVIDTLEDHLVSTKIENIINNTRKEITYKAYVEK